MTKRILLVENERPRQDNCFARALAVNGFSVTGVESGSEALLRLSEAEYDLVLINAASKNTSGVRMSRAVKDESTRSPVMLVSGAADSIPEDAADEIIKCPCTPRTILNRVNRFLLSDPEDELIAGPIRLDPKQRVVRCHGKITLLTTRLSDLLQALMKKPGLCVKRKDLMRKVWETTYMGDTRTLDTHISWLRKAIEPDPSQPRYLKTIRGEGYRLDVSSA